MSEARDKLAGTDLNSDQVQAFSDGVVAIAIITLVLEFEVPHILNALVAIQLLPTLLALWPAKLLA